MKVFTRTVGSDYVHLKGWTTKLSKLMIQISNNKIMDWT